MSEYLAVRAVPGGRLADGMAVDASILARLLGLRLLTLDARIRFVPTEVAPLITTSAAPATPSGVDDAGDLTQAEELLADAIRSLDQLDQKLIPSLRSTHI